MPVPVARRLFIGLVALSLLLAAPLLVRSAVAGQPVWRPRPATYGVSVTKDVPITMSDGVVLRADVLRPARADGSPAPGRFPVVLTQTPYNKNVPMTNFRSDYLVERGYVQVIVDVRGTGGSGGTWDSFGTREQRDGAELVEWCHSRRRPWSNGKVALHGTSYGALNQFLTAAQHPAGLKAMFPIVPMGDAYRDVVDSGGQVDTGFIPLWLGLVTATGLLPPSYVGSDPVDAARAVLAHAGGAGSFQTPTILSALSGGDLAYDGPFYRTRSPLEVIDKVDVPTFVVGGWYDLFQRSEPLLYQALRRNGVPTRLLMGPWYHLTASQGQGLPADGVPSLDELELRWFDHYVRGVPDPGLGHDISPVTYYELGRGHWVHTSGWLPSQVRYRALQLSGSARPGHPATLTPGQGTGAPDVLPELPITGVCSRSTVQWTAGIVGAGTPCETDNRLNDAYGLSYDFPVTKPLRLLGPMTAQLYVSSNGRDGQLTARVEDVAPDGTVSQLTAGWQVLSLRKLDRSRTVYRNGLMARPYHPFTKASVEPVPNGTPMEVDVEIFPTGALLEPGHTLRLTLQTADSPHLTAPLPQLADSLGGVLHVWHDARHPSRLTLPVLGR